MAALEEVCQKNRLLDKTRYTPNRATFVLGVTEKLDTAAPLGQGGARNSFSRAIAAYLGGLGSLRRWCSHVRAGEMSPAACRLWADAAASPFFASGGVGVRRAVCGEALFKFAMRVVFETRTTPVDRACGKFQCGRAGTRVVARW